MDKVSKTRESEADKNSHRTQEQSKSNTAVKQHENCDQKIAQEVKVAQQIFGVRDKEKVKRFLEIQSNNVTDQQNNNSREMKRSQIDKEDASSHSLQSSKMISISNCNKGRSGINSSKKSEMSDDIDSFDELEDKHDVMKSMDRVQNKHELPLIGRSSFAPKNKRQQANKHLSLQINNNIIDKNQGKMGVQQIKGNTANSHNRGHESQELLLEEEDTPGMPFKINVKVADKTNDNSTNSIIQNDIFSGHTSPSILHPVKCANNSDNKEEQSREDYDSNNGNLLVPRTYKEDTSVPKKDFNAEEIELIKKQQHRQILDQIGEAEPIFELPHKYAGGSDSPAWKKKQIRHNTLNRLKDINEKVSEECSLNTGDSEDSEYLPGDANSTKKDSPGLKQQKKNTQNQEKYQKHGEKIVFTTQKAIKTELHPDLFAYQIYDGYRPENLQHTRDYVSTLISKQEFDEDELPIHMIEYMENELKTELPEWIRDKNILIFDQNFECGNLDSVYIHNTEIYNLLMKVDCNTRGNTYWFYFKVSNFRVGVTYTFNIYNFTRSMEKFYKEGMNIVTRAETKNQLNKCARGEEPEWRYNLCKNIIFEQSEVYKTVTQPNTLDGQQPRRQYYSKMSFQYTFTEEDQNKYVYFCYATPYTYSDLERDLLSAKTILMSPIQPEDGAEVEAPTFKSLSKTDYMDYAKFKNFHDYQNDDFLGLVSAHDVVGEIESPATTQTREQASNLSSPKKMLSLKRISNRKVATENALGLSGSGGGHNRNLNHFRFQQDQIKKISQQQMTFKTNKFEVNFIRDQNQGGGKLKDHFWNEGSDDQSKNFEITNRKIHYRQEVIAQSMGGLNIYQITITGRREAGSIRHKKKKCIYIQARLHAAETHGSFVMKSILQELTENYQNYEHILNNNIIKLVPMINPDGVVIGNSRSSLAGVDLNRRWCNPNSTIHPELYFLKNNMRLTAQQSAGIGIFCDLHGHNKQNDCFFFGCNKAPNEGLLSWTKTRLLPKIFGSIDSIFDFSQCKFSQEKTKYNTARVVVWNEFQVTNSFTLETSQFAKTKSQLPSTRVYAKKGEVQQLVYEDLKQIGINLMRSIKQFKSLEAVLDNEFKKKGGQLNMKRLHEVVGVSARKKKLSEYIQSSSTMDQQTKSKQTPMETKNKKKVVPSRHMSFNNANMINTPLIKRGNMTTQKQNSSRNVFQNDFDPKSKENKEAQQIQASTNPSSINHPEGPQQTNNKLKKAITKIQSSNSKESEATSKDKTENSQSNSHSPQKRTFNKKSEPQGKKIKIEENNFDEFLPECLAEFFGKGELQIAIQESEQQVAKSDSKQQQLIESDSEPSCDNIDVKEINKEFSAVLTKQDMAEIEQESQPYIERINQDIQERVGTEEEEQRVDTIEDQFESSVESQTHTLVRNSNGGSKITKRKKNNQILAQEAQNVDIQKIKKQINNIEDYRVMAQKVIEAGKETKRLSQKFDRLEKEIKQKMSDSNQQYRGNWDHIASESQFVPTTQPEVLKTRIDKRNQKGQTTQDILQYLQGGLNYGSQGHQRNKSENHGNGSIFPAVQTHQMKILPPQESNKNSRNKSSINATSAAKDKKYESRNSILNVTQYNMGLGLPQTASSNVNYEMDIEGSAGVNRRINIGQRANRPQKVQYTNTPISVSQKTDLQMDPRNMHNQNSMIQQPNYMKMLPDSQPTGIGNITGFSQNEKRHVKRQNLNFNKRQTLGVADNQDFQNKFSSESQYQKPNSSNHTQISNKYPEIHQNSTHMSNPQTSANGTRYHMRGQEQQMLNNNSTQKYQANESISQNSKLKHQQTFHTPKKQQLLQLEPGSSKQSQRTNQKVPNNNFQLYIQINHIQMPSQTSQTNRQNEIQPQTQVGVHNRQNARTYADKLQEVVANRAINTQGSNQMNMMTAQPNSRKSNKRHIIDTAPYHKKNRHLAQSIDMSSQSVKQNFTINQPKSPQNQYEGIHEFNRKDYVDSNLKRKLTQPQNSVLSENSLN